MFTHGILACEDFPILTRHHSSLNYGKLSSSSLTATKMARPSYLQACMPTSHHPRPNLNMATQLPARTIRVLARTLPPLMTAMARTATESRQQPVWMTRKRTPARLSRDSVFSPRMYRCLQLLCPGLATFVST